MGYMDLRQTHVKVNNITDWTQAELDAQIALGNYPPGTLLADISLPSDWNDYHQNDYLQYLVGGVQRATIVGMSSSSYTMTSTEIAFGTKVLTGAVASQQLYWPSASMDRCVTAQFINTQFCSYDVDCHLDSGGDSCVVPKGCAAALVIVVQGFGVYSVTDTGAIVSRKYTTGVTVDAAASVSIVDGMQGMRLYCSNAGNVNVTIPFSGTIEMGSNAWLRVQAGAGGATLVPDVGVNLYGATAIAPYDCIILERDGVTDDWYSGVSNYVPYTGATSGLDLGSQTFATTGAATLGGNVTYTPTVNNSLTGANQRIPSHTTANIVFTNAGLTSLASANNGGVTGGHTLCIGNNTGAAITIVNDYASAAAGEKIYTGLNGDVLLPDKATFWLQYNATASAWECINGGLIPIASGVSGLGAGVATALGVATETAGGVALYGGNIVGSIMGVLSTAASNLTLPAGYNMYIPGPYEVSDGFTFEIGSGSILEIG